jgi:protein TonB
MFFAPPTRRTRPTTAALSLLAHGAVLLAFVGLGTHARVHTLPPAKGCCMAMLSVAGGSHRLQWAAPQPISSGNSAHAVETTQAPHKVPDPALPIHKAKEAEPAPAVAAEGLGSGAARGNGDANQNVTPAFPVFSPKPPVTDRALLPAAEQQIVVDVDVSATGEVTAETLVKGMGNALDQIVLETVKTWRFQPATADGKPVASESELIFPFNQKYPVARG